MCTTLLQVYACGHRKPVCTTPCPHAISTGTPIPNSLQGPLVNHPVPSKYESHSQSQPGTLTPLRMVTVTTSSPTRSAQPPPGLQAENEERSAIETLPSPPLSSIQISSPPTTTLHDQQQTQQLPHSNSLTSLRSTETLPPYSIKSYNTDAAISPGNLEEIVIEPNYCEYFFKRHLAPSQRAPCLNCYVKPEWAEYRAQWLNDYRLLHPNTKPEELEQMAGIAQIPNRVGLLNVPREMERMQSARERTGSNEAMQPLSVQRDAH